MLTERSSKVSLTTRDRRVRRGGGGALGARAPPPPHLGKKFRSEMSKRGEKVPPKYVGKKNVHVPLRYDIIKRER